MSGRQWHHDELGADLGAHLRAGGKHLTWENISVEGYSGCRPDVLAMVPWAYRSPGLVAYECKVSVSDFRSDVTSGKWMNYLQFCQGLTFAAPHGLIAAKDVPDKCGLILRSERGWRHVKKPTLQHFDIPMALWVKLVSTRPNSPNIGVNSYDVTRNWDYYRSGFERQLREEARKKIGKRHGAAIARFLEAPDRAEKMIDDARAEAKMIVNHARTSAQLEHENIQRAWAELRRMLDLPPDVQSYQVKQAIAERARLLSESGPGQELTRLAGVIRDAIKDSGTLQRLASAVDNEQVPA